MKPKILAAIMDISFVKLVRTVGFDSVVEQFAISKVKKFLVYDPRLYIPKVIVYQIEKEK